VDRHYPQAEKIRVVLDNLSTHSAASLYNSFAPQEARRIMSKIEFDFVPKQASWLNMAGRCDHYPPLRGSWPRFVNRTEPH